jgi:hypothetical protein
MKWSASEKGKLCSATKLLNNVSDNITLDDFLSTKLVILLVFENASTGHDRGWVIGRFCGCDPPKAGQLASLGGWVRLLDLTTHTSLSPIRRAFAPGFVNYKKLDSQLGVIKLTSCLPKVGGSLRVLRLPPPLKLVAMI